MIRKIMVALDESKKAEAEAVIALTAEMGQKLDAQIILFQAVEVLALMKEDRKAEAKEYKESALEFLNSIKNKLRDQGVDSSIFVEEGEPGNAVCEYAKKEGIDMIIIGARHRSRVGKLILGSIAQYIILEAPCPVLAKTVH